MVIKQGRGIIVLLRWPRQGRKQKYVSLPTDENLTTHADPHKQLVLCGRRPMLGGVGCICKSSSQKLRGQVLPEAFSGHKSREHNKSAESSWKMHCKTESSFPKLL